jgi:hypothetical protein
VTTFTTLSCFLGPFVWGKLLNAMFLPTQQARLHTWHSLCAASCGHQWYVHVSVHRWLPPTQPRYQDFDPQEGAAAGLAGLYTGPAKSITPYSARNESARNLGPSLPIQPFVVD